MFFCHTDADSKFKGDLFQRHIEYDILEQYQSLLFRQASQGIGQFWVQYRYFDPLHINQLAKCLLKARIVIMQVFGKLIQFNKDNTVFTGTRFVSVVTSLCVVDDSFQIFVYIVEQFIGDVFEQKIRFHTLSPLPFNKATRQGA